MAEEEKGTSSWYKVPTWSGNPAEWRSFKKEMSWWMASLDVESCRKYNVAARWALRQFGVVRARCEEFEPDELLGSQAITMPDPATGDETVVTPADPFAGLKKLMKALEESVGKTELDRRGELRAQFLQDMRRAPGERISAFCTRFRTLASELKREGIDLPKSELGWFLKDRMGLDAIRRQLLETALGGREEYDAVEGEVLRLFRDLHAADPLQKRAFEQKPLLQRFLNNGAGSSSSHRTSMPSSASSQASTFRSFRSTPSNAASKFPQRKPFQPSQRQALIAEAPEETYEPEEEEELVPADDGDGAQAQTLEEVLQTEAEILAAEIQELDEEGSIEPQLLEELETGVEAAAESLVTMREARTKIAEVRKDRGFGKIGGKGNANKAKQPIHGNQSQSKKVNTRCWDCGEQGHWGGDPQCGRPGAGLYRPKGKGGSNQNATKHVKITEALNTEHAVETVDRDLQPDHEVMTCDAMSWHEALNFTTTSTLFPMHLNSSRTSSFHPLRRKFFVLAMAAARPVSRGIVFL